MSTIAINRDLYSYAENYATLHNISITELVETYLRKLLKKDKEETFRLKEISELSPQVQRLVGIIPQSESDLNGDKAREEYLNERYGR